MSEPVLSIPDHAANYHFCLRVLQKLTRGRPIGIREAEDLANDAAFRFARSTSPDKTANPRAFLYGICRNIYRESCRAATRENQFLHFDEIPDIQNAPDDESVTPLTDEFVDQLKRRLKPKQLGILRELMFPEGRKRKEIAADVGMAESTFSEAVRRLTEKAHTLHAEMVFENAQAIHSVSGDSAERHTLETRHLSLARTPRERRDFRLQLAILRMWSASLRDITDEEIDLHLACLNRMEPDPDAFYSAILALVNGFRARWSPSGWDPNDPKFSLHFGGAINGFLQYGHTQYAVIAWVLAWDAFLSLGVDVPREYEDKILSVISPDAFMAHIQLANRGTHIGKLFTVVSLPPTLNTTYPRL